MKALTLLESGRLAHEVLSHGGGEVCAVFPRSVYLRFAGDRFVCLGGPTLGRGPINGVVAEGHLLHALRLGDQVGIRAGSDIVWPGSRASRITNIAALAGNLHALKRAAAGRVPHDGLGSTLTGDASPMLGHALPAVRALDEWLGAPRAPVPPAVDALLGLGPGLTPSGDDYLAGALVALRAIGRDADADRLWDNLRCPAHRLTHAISRAHLAAAAAGEAHEALHLCLEQLCGDGDAQWGVPLARLDAVGYCSGWDGLGGAVAVVRSVLRARRPLQ